MKNRQDLSDQFALIFEENTKRETEEKGLDFLNQVLPFTKIDDIDAQINIALSQGNKDIFVADSLRELARKTGIDFEGLCHRGSLLG